MNKMLLTVVIAISSLTSIAQVVDPSFTTSFVRTNEVIQQIHKAPDNSIYVSGGFNFVNDKLVPGVFRLTPELEIDENFLILQGSRIEAIQDDNKLLVSRRVGGQSGMTELLRLNTDGTIDETFSPSIFIANTRDIIILNNGKILLSGDVRTFNGNGVNGMVRLNENGTVDDSFNPGTGFNNVSSFFYKTAEQPDGKVIIIGLLSSYDGNSIPGQIFRINLDGSFDNSFQATGAGDGNLMDLRIFDDGKILISGSNKTFNGQNTGNIVRLFSDGELDRSFSPEVVIDETFTFIRSFDIKDDRIVVSGNIKLADNIEYEVVALDIEGTLDDSFLPSLVSSSVWNTIIAGNSKILIGGPVRSLNNQSKQGLGVLNPDGSVDQDFDVDIERFAEVETDLILEDGGLLISGNYTEVNGQQVSGLIKLDAAGSIDDSFNIGPIDGKVFTMIELDEGYLVGGDFNIIGDKFVTGLALVTKDGEVDERFNHPFDFGTMVGSIAKEGDDIYIGGNLIDFDAFASQSVIAKLDKNGNQDNSFFNIDIEEGFTNQIVILPNEKIAISGFFFITGDTRLTNFHMLNSDGSFDRTYNFDSDILFNPPFIVPLENGEILLTNLTSFAGSDNGGVLLLQENGSTDQAFMFENRQTETIKYAVKVEQNKLAILTTSNSRDNISFLHFMNTDGNIELTTSVSSPSGITVDRISQRDNDSFYLFGLFSELRSVETQGIALVNIAEHIPELAPITVSGKEDSSLLLDESLFLAAFDDPNLDELNSIKFVVLDENAELTLSGQAIQSEELITAENLNELEVTPSSNYFGKVTLSYRASDNKAFSNDGLIEIFIQPLNDAPTFTSEGEDLTLDENGKGQITVLFEDIDNEPSDLTLTFTSSNTDFVSVANISETGDGFERTVVVSANDNQVGRTTITAILSDGTLNDEIEFVVESDELITSITEPVITKISAYPNPFQGNIDLSLKVEEKTSISIYTASGKLIEELVYFPSMDKINIDLTACTSGFYIIKAVNESLSTQLKVLKR